MKERSNNQATNVPDVCRNDEYYYSLALAKRSGEMVLFTYKTKGEAMKEFFKAAKFEAYEYVMLYKSFNNPCIPSECIIYLHRK